MAFGKWVSYLRVSTTQQGKSGLGLDAQRAAVSAFLNGGRWTVLEEFTEVESGKHDHRPELAKAISLCRAHGAKLLIAKLDRLSRDAHFLLGLDKAGIEFVAADMPNANRLTVGIMAMVAEEERRMISTRTKDALAAAKARGVRLGGSHFTTEDGERVSRGGGMTVEIRELGIAKRQAAARVRGADLASVVAEVRAAGVTSATGLAKALTDRGIPTARGNATWSTVQAQRLLATIS